MLDPIHELICEWVEVGSLEDRLELGDVMQQETPCDDTSSFLVERGAQCAASSGPGHPEGPCQGLSRGLSNLQNFSKYISPGCQSKEVATQNRPRQETRFPGVLGRCLTHSLPEGTWLFAIPFPELTASRKAQFLDIWAARAQHQAPMQ